MSKQVAVVKGSLADIAARQGAGGLAASFVNASVVVLVDLSGSMEAHDGGAKRARYEIAFDELETLQHDMPGEIAVIGFADDAQFFPSGRPAYGMCGYGTNLTGALKFAKIADVAGVRFVVISDGAPNNKSGALAEARKYAGRIDVIYIGPETGPGRAFLDKLAKAAGGQSVAMEDVKQLAAATRYLLRSG